MFPALILVAIFSSALPFEAEAQQHVYKCNEGDIRKLYAYWHSKGGVPQHITERKVRCTPREIPFVSTQNFFDDDVTCASVDHFARSHIIRYLKGDKVYKHEAIFHEFSGQLFELLRQNVCFEIAHAGNATLLHLCSRRSDAKVGRSQYVVKGVEGETTEEDIKTLQDLLATTFECNEPLRSYPGCSSSLLTDKPHPVEAYCPSSSCSRHH